MNLPEKYFVIDFENTGGSLWYGHKITAYGICIVEKCGGVFKISETYRNYVNPGREIPRFIEELIGIKTEEVNIPEYLSIEDEFEKIEKILTKDMIFTAHCVGVDYDMFNYLYYQKYGRHLEILGIDTCQFAKNIIGLKKCGIAAISEYYNFDCGKHHEPEFDAYVAAQVLIKSIELACSEQKLREVFLKSIKKLPLRAHIKHAERKNKKENAAAEQTVAEDKLKEDRICLK